MQIICLWVQSFKYHSPEILQSAVLNTINLDFLSKCSKLFYRPLLWEEIEKILIKIEVIL